MLRRLAPGLGSPSVGRALPPLCLGAFVGLLYLRTLSPTTDIGDSLELQVVASQLTFAHSPGYSLYTLLGHLYTLLPWRDIAARMNLFSAHASTLAIIVLYSFTAQLTRSRLAGLGVALLAAFSPAFWRQAVTTEVYGLNSLLVLIVLLCLLRWTEAPNPRPFRWLVTTAFALGLACIHHPTAWALVPAVAIIVLVQSVKDWRKAKIEDRAARPGWSAADSTLRRRLLSARSFAPAIALAAAFALGLSPLLYFVIRSPAVMGHRMSFSELATFMTASGYRPLFHADRALADPTRLFLYAHELWRQFGGLPLVLAPSGVLWLARHRLPWLLGLGFFYAAIVAFRIGYYVWDGWVVQTPSHLLVAVAAGAGLVAMADGLQGLAARLPNLARLTGLVRFAIWVLVGLWLTARLLFVLPTADMSAGWPGYARAQQALAQPMPPGSWLVTDPDLGSGLLYDHILKNVRPDLTIAYADTGGAGRILADPTSTGHPVFLLDVPPPADPRLHPRSLGPLVELGTAPLTELPEGFTPIDAEARVPSLDDGGRPVANPAPPIDLRGIRVDGLTPQPPPDGTSPASISPDQDLGVTLLWQATGPVTEDLRVRTLLACDLESGIAGSSVGPPVRGGYPTSRWRAGELVPDWHKLHIDVDASPGNCVLVAGLIDSKGTERVSWRTFSLSNRDVPRPSGTARGSFEPTEDVSVRSGSASGLDADRSLQGSEQRARDLNALWRDRFGLFPLIRRWLTGRWPDEACPRGQTRCVGTELPVRFADGIRLVDYGGPLVAHPGERLYIPLRWEAYAQPSRRYSAYVHVLDPSEVQRAGVDREILHAAEPAYEWRPGERTPDFMPLDLPVELPPGGYRVQIGLYDQATKAPLPLVVSSGLELADDRLLFPLIILPRQSPPVSHPAAVRFGDELVLDGLDLTPSQGDRLVAGKPMTVTLRLRAVQTVAHNYSTFIHLRRDETIVAQVDGQPFDGTVPMSAWPAGQAVDVPFVLHVPGDAAAGRYELALGLYDLVSGQRLAVSAGGAEALTAVEARDDQVVVRVSVRAPD